MADKPIKEPVPEWARKLKARRILLGFRTQEEMAAATNYEIKQGTISELENGKTHPENLTAQRLAILLRVLDWTPEQFEEETGISLPRMGEHAYAELVNENIKSSSRRINVYDMIAAGPGEDGGTVIDVIDIPVTWHGEYVGYRISGDSMGAALNGATVVVRKQSYAEKGDPIVAYVPERGMVFKRYGGMLPGGFHLLLSQNPNHEPIWTKELDIKGKVEDIRIDPATYFQKWTEDEEV